MGVEIILPAWMSLAFTMKLEGGVYTLRTLTGVNESNYGIRIRTTCHTRSMHKARQVAGGTRLSPH